MKKREGEQKANPIRDSNQSYPKQDFTKLMSTIDDVEPANLNDLFLDFLEESPSEEKEKLAKEMCEGGIFKENERTPFDDMIFTKAGGKVTINPLVVRFGLEEFERNAFRDQKEKQWFENILVFLGEIALEKLDENYILNVDSDLEGLLEEYYTKNGFDYNPEIVSNLRNFLQYVYENEASSPVEDSQIIYYSLIDNLNKKLRYVALDPSTKNLAGSILSLLEIHKLNRSNPALFSDNPFNLFALKTTSDLNEVNFSMATHFASDINRYSKADEFFGQLIESTLEFKDSATGYNTLAKNILTHIQYYFTGVYDYLENEFNVLVHYDLFLDILEGLEPYITDEEVRIKYNRMVRYICNEILRIVFNMNYQVEHEHTLRVRASRHRKDQRRQQEMISKIKNSAFSLDEANEEVQKVKDIMLRTLERHNDRAKNWKGGNDEVFSEIVECTRCLSSYYEEYELKSEESFNIWRKTIRFLQNIIRNMDTVPLKLTGAAFFAKLNLANNVLTHDPKRKEFLMVMKDCRDDLKVMKNTIKRSDSSMAYELIVWFYYLMCQYFLANGEGLKATKWLKKAKHFNELEKQKGLTMSNQDEDFTWDV